MYNRKFINNLKKKYKKGGIKKYQQGSFMDQEMDAYEQLENMETSHNEWVDSVTKTDSDGATITVGRPIGQMPDEQGNYPAAPINYIPGLNINHDKFSTYSPFTQKIQTMFKNDATRLPEYLSTLSSAELNDLVVDMADNDLMGLPGTTDGVYNKNNTNPFYTEAVITASLDRLETDREDMSAQLVELKNQIEYEQMVIEEQQNLEDMSVGDQVDMTLSALGMYPGYGIVPDALNVVSNLGQSAYDLVVGDWDELKHDLGNTAWAAGSFLPLVGLGIGSGKQVKNINTIAKIGDKSTDARKIVDKRLKEIANKSAKGSDDLLPVVYKGGPPAVIVKNTDDLVEGGVNFVRVTDDAYPIVKYSDDMADIINNPINKNAGKGKNWWGRTKEGFHPTKGWKDSFKEVKEIWNGPIVNWKPGNRFIKPVAGAVRHFTTPKWMVIEGAAGTILWNIVDQHYIQPAEQAAFDQEQKLKWNKEQQERIQREMPIYGPESFNDTIPTGQNVYNMLTYQGKLQDWKLQGQDGVEYYNQETKKMDVINWNPDITDQDALDIFLSLYPLNWGEDTDNNFIKFGSEEEKKQTGGYRRRQMGGGYMGIPQQQPIGDEGGYMGQMQQFRRGGQNLPGGNVQPIPGSDAVQFNGQTHDQGGIMMDSQTEVEDGETMDKVNMSKQGGPKDYFFSSHLKKGGKSYAEHHKDILKGGGDQGSIDMLAKMQEKAAGRDPNKVSVARTGGYKRRYATGGTPERNIYSNEYSDVEAIYKELGYTDMSGGTNWRGIDHGPEGYENTQGENLQSGVHTGYYGDIGPAEREGFYNRNKDIMESMGVMKWEDFDPLTQTDNFQTKYNAFLTDEYTNNTDLQDKLKAKGMSSVQDYIDAVGFTNSGHGSQKIDNFFGSFTHGRTSMRGPSTPDPDPDPCECTDAVDPTIKHKFPCGDPEPAACAKTPKVPGKDPCDCDPKLAKDDPNCCKKPPPTWNPGPLQLLPAAYAFAEGPDYMSQHPMQSPAAIIPERLAKTNLERVDMNADRARNASDARGLNKFIETSGGGSSNIVNKMAAYSKKREADAAITDTENKTNIAISNQEAIMDQERKGKNVANALDASKFNVTSQSDANKHNSTMEATVDEFNRASDSAVKDRRLMALDNATKTMTGLYTDKLQFDAQERMAQAISGQTGVYQREQNRLAYSQQLISQGIQPGSQQYNDAMKKYQEGQPQVTGMRYGGYRRRY